MHVWGFTCDVWPQLPQKRERLENNRRAEGTAEAVCARLLPHIRSVFVCWYLQKSQSSNIQSVHVAGSSFHHSGLHYWTFSNSGGRYLTAPFLSDESLFKPKRRQLHSSFWKLPQAPLVFKFSTMKKKRESRLDEWEESGCQWNRGHLGYHDAAHARMLPSPRFHLTLGEEASRTCFFSLGAKRSYTCRRRRRRRL